LRVISNWSVGLKNPGAINLQSSRAEPMPSAYGLLCRVDRRGPGANPQR
jgi:hypothetical protein